MTEETKVATVIKETNAVGEVLSEIVSNMVANDNDVGNLKAELEANGVRLEVEFLLVLAKVNGDRSTTYDKIKELING